MAISLAPKTLSLAHNAYSVQNVLPTVRPQTSTPPIVHAPVTSPINFGTSAPLPAAPAANTIVQYKQLKDPAVDQLLAAETWKKQVSAPGYQPTTADVIAAGAYGLLDWFHTIFPPHPDPAEVASADLAGDLASNAYNPSETIDNYSGLVALDPNTGHVASRQEVRTFYVHFYNSLAAQVGL